jgi:[ribosomal protein S5]-alanine N-acetyltransferase
MRNGSLPPPREAIRPGPQDELRPYDCPVTTAIPYPEPALRSDLFVLRAFRNSDFEVARKLELTSGGAPWIEALPEADGESMERACERSRLEGAVLQLVIADPNDDVYLGEVSLVMLEPGTAELGCAVVPEARGRGIGSEALRLASTWALAQLPLRRLQVMADTQNLAALTIAERAGYRREGVLRSYWEIDGKPMDAVLLSRLPGDQGPPGRGS